MNITEINIEELKPYERNTKKHEQKQIDNLAESIKQFGFIQPIVIDKDNCVVIGHCRLLAAKKLEMQTVPAVCVDSLSDEEVKKLRLLDNKLNESEWDFNILAKEIADLDLSDFDFNWNAFDDIDSDDFGDDFKLKDGDKNEICQMTLTLHERQKELIEWAMANCGECTETFGNVNKQGNQVYEVIRQWADARK